MGAGRHVFLRTLAGIAQHHNPGADFRRALQYRVEVVVKASGNNQHSRAELVERHEHLLGRLGLRDDAHLVFDRENFCDPRAKNSLVVCQNEFQHCLRTSRLRLANKIVRVNYASHTLVLAGPGVLAHHTAFALHYNVLGAAGEFGG